MSRDCHRAARSSMPSPGGEAVAGVDRAGRARLSARKFLPPPLPGWYVPRPRLDDRLDQATAARMIVVTGPAGAGKSALVAAFLAGHPENSSWITLDERDNDPPRFWTNLSYGFDRLFAGAHGPSASMDDPAQYFLRSALELA